MSHAIISGMTESGKTTLAKMFARKLKKRGFSIAVCDSQLDPEWGEVDFLTDDPYAFIEWAKANKNAFLFVDESGTTINKYDTQFAWLTSTARHNGHSSYLVCHTITQLSPALRLNCKRMYFFASSARDGKMVADEWNEPTLKNLDKLNVGEFYIVSKFDNIEKAKINFPDDGKRVDIDSLSVYTLMEDQNNSKETTDENKNDSNDGSGDDD